MIRLDSGACHDSPELFHPGVQDQETVTAAQGICGRCPVRLDCLALALGNPNAAGIWGGLTLEQRTRNRPGGVDGDSFTTAVVGEPHADELAAHSRPLSEANRCGDADGLHDRVIRRLFTSGLKLNDILNASEVDDDVAARLGQVINDLDAAVRDMYRTAFARIVQDDTGEDR